MIRRSKRYHRRSKQRPVRRFESLEPRQLLATSVLFADNLNDVTLGAPVDEGQVVVVPDYDPNFAWTDTPPSGWSVDDSGVPGSGDLNTDGVTEWAGWSFADKKFWIAADDQRRSEFVYGQGVVAVADPDEWDDKAHNIPVFPPFYNAFMETPAIEIPGGGTVAANSVFISFDSSWRDEAFDDGDNTNNQTATITASYSTDGGATFGSPVEVLRWDSDPNSDDFHDDAPNEAITNLSMANPANVTHVKLEFGLTNAGNDWWWAVDNITLQLGTPAGEATSHYLEDFESVTLGNSVDETFEGFPYPDSWSEVPPAGWSMDDSGVPGAGDPANDGVTEWAGWAMSQKLFWVLVAEDEGRDSFVKDEDNISISDNNIIAVADPDEWDDLPHLAGDYNALMLSEPIDLTTVNAALADPTQVLQVRFDSSWNPYDDQTAMMEVSYDGGVTFVPVMRWASDGSDPDYKGANLNEVDAVVDLPNPQGAPTAILRFGLTQAGDDWWWAIDDVELVTRTAGDFQEPFFSEDFEDVPLGPPVDEKAPLPFYPTDNGVWAGGDDALPGWLVDNTGAVYPGDGNPGVPGLDDPAIGVTEWEGWGYADPMWWAIVGGDQNRSQATKLDQVAAIADPDEWDDKGSPTALGSMNTLLISPTIDLTGVEENTAQLIFDSSWRPEDAQTALVEVTFDGGTTWNEVLMWTSTNNGALAGDPGTTHEEDQTVTVQLNNPADTTEMQIRFAVVDAVNNWWWAIDNIRVVGEMTTDSHSWTATGATANWGDDSSWSGDGVPSSNWAAEVETTEGIPQVAVVNEDSNVSSVTLRGLEGPITLRVNDGAQLAADTITIGANAVLAGGGHVVGDIVFDGGTIAPGASTGELDIIGNVGANGTYELQIGTPKVASVYPLFARFYSLNGDSLDITESLDLSGDETLTLSFVGGPVDNLPKAGTTVLMVASEGIAGQFETIDTSLLNAYVGANSVQITPLGPGGLAATDEPVAMVTLKLLYDLLPGDADASGDVTARDFAILRGNFGKTGMTWAQGDFDGDGNVTARDFAILRGNFGSTVFASGSNSGTSGSVGDDDSDDSAGGAASGGSSGTGGSGGITDNGNTTGSNNSPGNDGGDDSQDSTQGATAGGTTPDFSPTSGSSSGSSLFGNTTGSGAGAGVVDDSGDDSTAGSAQGGTAGDSLAGDDSADDDRAGSHSIPGSLPDSSQNCPAVPVAPAVEGSGEDAPVHGTTEDSQLASIDTASGESAIYAGVAGTSLIGPSQLGAVRRMRSVISGPLHSRAAISPQWQTVDLLMSAVRTGAEVSRPRDGVTEVSDELALGVTDELITSVAKGWRA